MTTQQLYLMNGVYLVALVVVAVLTRATARRIAGALAGGAVFGLVALCIIALCERRGLWRVPLAWEPYFLSLLVIDFAVSCAVVYLLTWRVARRFGWRGLAGCVAAAAGIGPIRDYRVAAWFPGWIEFGPGVAPVLAVAATYVVMVVLGHGVMRLVAGPAREDRLARRPWGAA